MENIEERRNATVITGNTKLMMRIAGVLFAMLVAVQIIYNLDVSIINVFADHNNYIYLRHYIDLALFVSEILFSMACIIQKKSFFSYIFGNYNRSIFIKNCKSYNTYNRKIRFVNFKQYLFGCR